MTGQSALTTTDNEWDFMPAGSIKTLHPIGGVCKFEIEIRNPQSKLAHLKVPPQMILPDWSFVFFSSIITVDAHV